MSNGQKFYCMCGNNCKYETMTKEQILAAIVQAVETGTIMDVDTGFVTRLKEQNSGTYISFWIGTKEQYNRLTNKDKNCLYIISDDTTTEDLRKMIEDLQKDVQDAAARAAQSAPWGLVTMKNVRISSMEDLDELLNSAVESMEVHSVKVISCTLEMSRWVDSAQITIHKGTDDEGLPSVRVCVESDYGRAMQRKGTYSWENGEVKLSWDEWEYINPVMSDGVEYRTTERHNGLPVYVWTKTANMPKGVGGVVLNITENATANFKIVSIDAVETTPADVTIPDDVTTYKAFPVLSSAGGSPYAACSVRVQPYNGSYSADVLINSFVDTTGDTVTVTVKYTK